MRIAADDVCCIDQPDLVKAIHRESATIRSWNSKPAEMLIELIADRANRVQRRHRLLRNETDSATKQLAPGARCLPQQIPAVEHHAPARDLEARRQQTRDDPPDHAFPSARFAD